MRTIHLIIALLLAAAIGACAGDKVSSPNELPGGPLFDEGGGTDCDWYIDDGSCDPPDGSYTTDYYETLDGSATTVYDLGYIGAPSYADGAQAICPPAFQRMLLPAIAVDDGDPDNPDLPFVTSGFWRMVFNQIYPFPFTRYTWPAGFWPATDGTGREISIGTGDAWCIAIVSPDGRVGVRVNFYAFHGVEIRRPSDGNGAGDGGSGGGTNCHEEWVVLEVNYNDGTGWHVLWEGWASVCE